VADTRAHPPGDGWFDEWEATHTNADGFFIGWSGVPTTWEPYWEQDYFGVNAVRASGFDGDVVSSYSAARDVEKRLTLVDPLKDVPDKRALEGMGVVTGKSTISNKDWSKFRIGWAKANETRTDRQVFEGDQERLKNAKKN
jgi:hypothetical protein